MSTVLKQERLVSLGHRNEVLGKTCLKVASYLACQWKLWVALDGLLERLFALDGVSQVLISDSQEHKTGDRMQVVLVLHLTRR